MQKTLSFICCIVSFVLMWGCVASSNFYIGKTVDSADIIPLQGGLHKGVSWETFDVVLLFDYELKDGTLYCAGKGRLGDHYQAMYTHLRYFEVYLFQVGENGRVLHTVRLPTLSMSSPDDDFNFDKVLKIFPETIGLSFGYSGAAYERERSEPIFIQFFNETSFHNLPHK